MKLHRAWKYFLPLKQVLGLKGALDAVLGSVWLAAIPLMQIRPVTNSLPN